MTQGNITITDCEKENRMRIEKKDRSEERQILTAMIVDTTVLRRICAKKEKRLFRVRWSNMIAAWCMDYYERYNEAPKSQIESLFSSWASTSRDKDIVGMVEKFLSSLSDEYDALEEESNSQYTIDVADEYFNRVRLERLSEEIKGDIESGDVGKAEDRVGSFRKLEMGAGAGIDLFQSPEIIQEAFEEKAESIIEYPGALGRFFGSCLGREDFVVFQAVPKGCKSFWLQDIVIRGISNRLRVAHFEAGDLGQNKIVRRIMERVTRHPSKASTIRLPVSIKMPPGGEQAEVEYREKEFGAALSWRRSFKQCKKFMKKTVRSKHSYFKLSAHPNSSISVSGIEDIIHGWQRDGWSPDIISVDYLDILKPESDKYDKRDQINETCKRLRALAQKTHALVVTGSQAAATAYASHTMGKKDFSEDHRKLAHTTGIVGINATEAEKDAGITRLNWVVNRYEHISAWKCVHVAGCLAIANPAIKSTF